MKQGKKMAEPSSEPSSRDKALSRQEKKLLEAVHEISVLSPSGDEILYVHAVLAQLGLPRRRTSQRVFERPSASSPPQGVSLRLEAGSLWGGDERRWVPQPLPYGAMSRAILLNLFTVAIQHGPEIDIGRSPTAYVKALTGAARGGARGNLAPFRQHIAALAAVTMSLGISYGNELATFSGKPIHRFDGWIAPNPDAQPLWPRTVHLAPGLYSSLCTHGVPLDRRAIKILGGSALGLDIYAWLSHRLYRLRADLSLSWYHLHSQFGHEYKQVRDFRREFKRQMKQVQSVYPKAKISLIRGGILLKASPPPVPRRRPRSTV